MVTLRSWALPFLFASLLAVSHSFQKVHTHVVLQSPVNTLTNRWSRSSNDGELSKGKSVTHYVSRKELRASSNGDGEQSNERKKGILVLLTVPLAWGTFEPAVRYVYEIKPAVPVFVFSVGYYLVAAVTLSILALVDASEGKTSNDPREMTLPSKGGIELGAYLFVGNALQVLGLQTVPSDRAAFLLQLTTIFVPLVQAAINRDLSFISLKICAASLIALIGVVVIGFDGQDNFFGDTPFSVSFFRNISQGDLLIVAAAFSYTFHCIRLERFAKETYALKLGAAKATTELLLCLTLVLTLLLVSSSSEGDTDGMFGYVIQSGREISNYFNAMKHTLSEGSISVTALLSTIGAVLWTGLVTVAYTITAQSFGQARVAPITANLIYTIQPLFTALFAYCLLGETLGPTGYVGGALIASAVYLVAVD